MIDEKKKKCKNCNIEKNINEFHIDKSKKFGVKNVCKKCRNKKIVRNKNLISLNKNIKNSIYKSIKYNKKFSWEKILGYSIDDLKHKLEKEFKPDMNWGNYGKLWDIKKIIKDKFYFSQREIKNSWNIKNLIPLYKKENLKFNLDIIEEKNLYDILPIGSWKIKDK